MIETDLNKRITSALADQDPRRVENSVGPGTPDINFVGGWIEDKMVAFPKRADTVVAVDHYTSKQRAWHRRRCAAGGKVFVALQDSVSGAVYLFNAWDAAAHLGIDWTVETIASKSLIHLPEWDPREFRKQLLRLVAKSLSMH